ncbi:MAG TPA: indolepyruvate ferredoxin oxidoreductase family protein [Dehalococcoidia bacterium]|nr:indolepyruvate ferredoxin oxidoreductase family protein [Dehalococcoidia bacterium]
MTSTLDLPPLDRFSLDDKYTLEAGRIYLTGIQALVRLPMDQHRADARRGLRTATFISGYRGSPLGGYDIELDRNRTLLDAHHVVHQPGLNEENAATAVYGSQLAGSYPGAKYDGVLGIWYGKGPGVDRTGDVFKHANHAGVGKNGGVIALGGDDPNSKSSTLPSDSTIAFYDALMPTVYPGTVQEVLDLGLHAFALSRASGLWTAMKFVTNVADSAGTAEVAPERIAPIIPGVELDGRPYTPQQAWRLLPPQNLEMERTLHYARLELARRYAEENRLNRVTISGPNDWLGIVAAGKTYADVRQALDELGLDEAALNRHGVRLFKVGMLFPFTREAARQFAAGLREVLVIEEKRAFLELLLKDALYDLPERPRIVGKTDEQGRPLVPSNGELDAEIAARVIASRLRRLEIPSVERRLRELDGAAAMPAVIALARTPYYCSGCPHNTSNIAPEGSFVGAGIGCHSMGLWMDTGTFGEILGITQMGGEGSQWVGAAPFTETRHIFQNVGDGTLFHSGQMALNFAVASGVNITYKVLYNAAVAMTGGQVAVGTLPVPALIRRLEAEGVKQIIVTSDEPEKYRGVPLAPIAEVWPRGRIVEAQAELAKIPGVTVLIHDQQCAAEKRRLRKRGKLEEPPARLFINERVCEGCGDCGHASNCLSVQPVETEFGRKTAIHQPSCNKDYSCLKGDCPAFLTVTPGRSSLTPGPSPNPGRGENVLKRLSRLPFPQDWGKGPGDEGRTAAQPPTDLPAPRLLVPADGWALHMLGIGGTGVVTVNQILGTAARLDGKHVWGLDQTGLSQKGGPVVSDLRLSSGPMETAKLSAGGADLYLGFDLLVACAPQNLAKADPARTVAVVSTSQVATGQMVTDTLVQFPALAGMLRGIEAVTRKEANVYLDAQALAEALFGTNMPANLLTLGSAWQAGAVPISLASIEQAIRLNGAAVVMNLAAFTWGRAWVAAREQVEAALRQAAPPTPEPAPPPPAARRLLEASRATGELRRLLEIRVPELIAYQDKAYAAEYVRFVMRVARAEAQRTPGQTALAEAVARYLYKLMAYKDEYEVARLQLDPAQRAALRAQVGAGAKVEWNLHPPLLRALGLKHKISLGSWFTPAMHGLKAAKALRGTPLDLFGYAEVRRIERALIAEYRALIERALETLTPATHADAVALAGLPDQVRGYEQIKLANVATFREQAAAIGDRLLVTGDR